MTGKLDPWFHEWLIKEKLRYSISARFLVRFHVALILAGAVAAGWVVNRLLYAMDVKSMLVRHPIAVVGGYIGFLLGLQLWIRYSGIREYVNSRRAKELLEPEGFKPQGLPPPKDFPIADFMLFPEGCLFLLLLLLVWAIAFALGGYLIVYAAELMTELVFQLLLAAGLVRGIRRVDMLADFGIPAMSLWALAGTLALAVFFGLFARNAYPQATTIAEVVRQVAAK